jgi:hypothetical protein
MVVDTNAWAISKLTLIYFSSGGCLDLEIVNLDQNIYLEFHS